MSDTRNVAGARTPHVAPAKPSWTGWTGWVVFAGVMMIMIGAFHAISGFVAIFDPGYYLVGRNGLVVSVDYTTWGWVHLLLGAVALIAGIAVLSGQMWGRVVGIAMAVVSAIAELAFIAAYPIWSTIVIAIDVIVIYALTVHGKEAKAYD